MNLIGNDWLSIYLLVSLIATPILAIIGTKKRLGFKWSFFFALFAGFLFGTILIILSPSKKNLPPPKESEKWNNKFFGALLLILGGIWLYSNYRELEKYPDQNDFASTLGSVLPGLFSLIASSYFFFRYDRHKNLYEKYVLGVKKIEDKDLPNGMPPPDEELDTPIYEQTVK